MKKLVLSMIALLALVAGPCVRAQQAGNSPDGAAPAQTILKSGTQILSDTMGVDFSDYIHRVHADVQRNWEPLIPAKAGRPELKKGIVGIRLTILPDGKLGSMKLETPSGDVDLDKAAWFAITGEGQFPALPQAFHGPLLDLRLGFYYNTNVAQAK